jgi:hypothetical protein
MKSLLLKLLAACILMTAAPIASLPTMAEPKVKKTFKKTHFGKKDHMKFKKVKKKKPKYTKSKNRPERKLHRHDAKRMHNGDTKAYLLGIPIKKKGYNPKAVPREF